MSDQTPTILAAALIGGLLLQIGFWVGYIVRRIVDR